MRYWQRLAILSILLWSGVWAWPGWAASHLPVVATFSILGDWVQTVGGDKINLYTLVGPGADTHTFEPSPTDSVKVAQAKLIFENGLNFEIWLEKMYQSAGSKAQRVVVTTGLSLLPTEEEDAHAARVLQEEKKEHDHKATPEQQEEKKEEHAHAEKPGHGPEHEHGEFNPHVWLDVEKVLHMVKNIRDALVKADPVNANTYRANAERYGAALQELDTWIVTQVQTVPEEKRKLVTAHDTLRYFAQRYGFTIVGTALGPSTEAADPAAGKIAALVEKIKATRVPAIFAENIHNPKLMERIAQEAGVQLAPTLYTDALGAPGSTGDTYLTMMRYNVISIVTALRQ
jgi:ABC-type Zn uptake system ZnuABC Zn-binding protein ZnuA